MVILSKYIVNINRVLKNIKSDVVADFIHKDNKELIITTDKVVATSDLNTIKNYIKNIDVVNSNKIISPRLSQSKSYLKILGISYYIKDINLSITANIVERVL